MGESDPLLRLVAAGFAPGEAHRALLALAGDRIPPARRLRAWRAVELAACLLAEGRPQVEVARVLTARYGISRRTAYYRIESARAVQRIAPLCTTGRQDTPQET